MNENQNTAGNIPNRLINEKSPYLLQHAHNPVDWYPWCEEAFEKARTESKPIFLSVGYSTCHWCHVMAHESFENADVAGLLNEVFVCIKVDREERPDIDKVYMDACQMMTGSGGWPLTIVMTPDRQPFFAATYIPRESRFGRVGMLDLIPKIQEAWKERRDDIVISAGQIVASMQQKVSEVTGEALSKDILDEAYKELKGLYDEKNGGFGSAPKFPMPHQLLFLLRYWKWSGEKKALEIVVKTLRAMRCGGIYDHIGYGFHRYSTDEKWLVPHFEKMLYDQAMLAMAYTEAYQATGHETFKRTACEIFNYIMRDMKSLTGGFYSAEDADSEGEEGKYYLWRHDEIERILEPSEAELVLRVFQVKKAGNFVDPLAGGKTGHNILHLEKPTAELASVLGISEESLRQRMAAVRMQLFSARERRTRPHKDDKILTDWNGLMIAALAKGAQAFADQVYLKAAQKAVNFIVKNMREVDGRLFHRHRDGEAAITASIDDYAFLIWGLLECYEASYDVTFLKTALRLQEDLTRHFWDKDNGGYYFTPDDGENLILRQKEIYDGAVPSGNSVAMLNLIRLSRLTGNHELEAQAAAISRVFAGSIRRSPAGHAQFMIAMGFLTHPAYEIVIAGRPGAEDTEEMLREIGRQYLPNTVVLLRPPEELSSDIISIAPFTKDLKPIDDTATAYVCTNFTCHSPTTDSDEMLRLLNLRKP
ncbi:MAG: thioredoxin domain-containing protein [Deltaproteobacteria bacterium]|nr:thioredoxin domain-containing protein [Deltaproteobacteria bacterium]